MKRMSGKKNNKSRGKMTTIGLYPDTKDLLNQAKIKILNTEKNSIDNWDEVVKISVKHYLALDPRETKAPQTMPGSTTKESQVP